MRLESISTELSFTEVPELLDHLGRFDRVGIDTEADSLHCYREKFCLIQISSPERDLLADPLAAESLQPLVELLASKQLVMQGADFDLRMLRRIKPIVPDRVFDTLIAARLAGIAECSLQALVQRFFGVTLPKHSQKANWARRPLPSKMLEYAINDSRYLLPLADELERELHRLGRFEWFIQSCRKAVSQAMVHRERDVDRVWRLPGSSRLSDRGLAILRALWHWREQEAQHSDRPPFHILGNEQLIDAATRLEKGDSISFPRIVGSRKKRLDAVVEGALQLPESAWPPKLRGIRTRRSYSEERRLAELKKKRNDAARALGIEESLIAPRATLEKLVKAPETLEELLLPWQRELVGL